MYVSPLFALVVLLLVALPSLTALWRLWKRPGSFLKWTVVVVSLLFALFMVALELHGIDWLWRWNEVVIYRAVAIFYAIYLPWAVYGGFSLLDLVGEKHQPAKNWRFRYVVGIPLLIVVYAFLTSGFFNRHNLTIEREEVESSNLPNRFDGKTIVVLSDLHLGTLVGNQAAYLHAIVDSVNSLQPDLVFFVGDMVNVYANEGLGPHIVLQELQARIGKYAVMGNHDYGGYFPFDDENELVANEERMREMYESCGFHLLANEGVEIAIDDTNKINVVGIENWGTGRFPKYGDLDAAMRSVNDSLFTILLSHDPTAWRPLVLAADYPIALTLSGHTHGGQCILFGLSPAMKDFEFWNGLAAESKQYIYVSRGLGYTIVPMRIGKGPEISLITLRKK